MGFWTATEDINYAWFMRDKISITFILILSVFEIFWHVQVDACDYDTSFSCGSVTSSPAPWSTQLVQQYPPLANLPAVMIASNSSQPAIAQCYSCGQCDDGDNTAGLQTYCDIGVVKCTLFGGPSQGNTPAGNIFQQYGTAYSFNNNSYSGPLPNNIAWAACMGSQPSGDVNAYAVPNYDSSIDYYGSPLSGGAIVEFQTTCANYLGYSSGIQLSTQEQLAGIQSCCTKSPWGPCSANYTDITFNFSADTAANGSILSQLQNQFQYTAPADATALNDYINLYSTYENSIYDSPVLNQTQNLDINDDSALDIGGNILQGGAGIAVEVLSFIDLGL